MASKSRPTTEAPPFAARRGQEWPEGFDQGFERVGRDVEGNRDLVPIGGEHAAAQAVRRGEADGVEEAVEAVPALAPAPCRPQPVARAR